ncbi:4-alpha-glucanotransferase [Erysipelotrichaceae bacterium 51-3]
MTKKIGPRNIIAEDLGILTPSVEKMLHDVGYPGMKVLEFGLFANTTEGQEYLPFSYPIKSVAYAGTHDNDTIYGWFNSLSEVDQEYVREYLDTWDPKKIHWRMFAQLLNSPSDTTIVMAQDLLGLGSESRMNKPGELGSWQWRLIPGQLDEDTMRHLKYLTRVYRRLPEQRIDPKKKKTVSAALAVADLPD